MEITVPAKLKGAQLEGRSIEQQLTNLSHLQHRKPEFRIINHCPVEEKGSFSDPNICIIHTEEFKFKY